MTDINEKLRQVGVSDSEIEALFKEAKQQKRLKNKNIGMFLILLVLALCLGSMLSSYFLGPSPMVLYGLTTIGVVLAFVGLVYVMQ
jgi:hypothetical protein